MATFITDRTQADVDTSLTLFNKVKSTAWASLSSAEQNAYLSTDTLHEDRGRFSIASAERISSYMRELTSQLLEEVPSPIPTTIDGRSVGIWGSRNFKADPDYPSGTEKTFTVANVDISTDYVTITSHGLTVGQWYRVLYTTSSTTLGGLTSGDFYDVYIVDANTVAFRYGGIGTDITSKPGSGTYTLNFITAPYFAISRDDFQYWVDILTAKYGANPTGWTPINSPYLNFETLNILEQKTEAILSGSIATITETSGTYMTNDEMLIFDDYLGL